MLASSASAALVKEPSKTRHCTAHAPKSNALCIDGERDSEGGTGWRGLGRGSRGGGVEKGVTVWGNKTGGRVGGVRKGG